VGLHISGRNASRDAVSEVCAVTGGRGGWKTTATAVLTATSGEMRYRQDYKEHRPGFLWSEEKQGECVVCRSER